MGRLRARGVEVHLEAEEETLTQGIDLVVKSPGVRADAPLVAAARARGVPIWDELELGARLLSNPIVAVTGTNGKTTTTALLGEMFRADGRPVEVAGNIGRALSSLVGSIEDDAWIVCEVGVFQLDDMQVFHPRIGVLVNLEPDHLDRYGDFEHYAATKLRMFALQTEDDTAVLPRGFGPVPGGARVVEFAGDDPLPAEPSIPGAHNRENAAAATAAARAAGVSDDAIARALRRLPRRRASHRRHRDASAVCATSTTPRRRTPLPRCARSRRFALRACTSSSADGARARATRSLLRRSVTGDRAYLIGEAAADLAAALAARGRPVRAAGDLETAVALAAAAASPGEVVLLSPACASFDQFRDFEARGDAFRELVEARR